MGDGTDPVGVWEVGAAEYHADRTCDSHSTLDVFRESPRLYYETFVTGSVPRKEPTDDMRVGTAVHALLLEPETYGEQVVVCPPFNRRKPDENAEYKKFLADHAAAGRTVLTEEQEQRVRAIRDGIVRNKIARVAVEQPGRSELAVRWTDPVGARLRCKMDRWVPGGVPCLDEPDTPTVLDIKVTNDPTPDAWVRTAGGFGYHRQEAMYRDGAYLGMGHAKVRFMFIVVGKDYPHDTAVLRLCRLSVEKGREQYRTDAARVVASKAYGIWDSYYSDRVIEVSVPAWA